MNDPFKGIPKRLRIIGKHYRVTVVNAVIIDGAEDPDSDGHSDQGSQIIQIKGGRGFEYSREVALHEAIHAVDHQMKSNLSEAQVEKLGTGILALLRDNRSFVEWLLMDDEEE